MMQRGALASSCQAQAKVQVWMQAMTPDFFEFVCALIQGEAHPTSQVLLPQISKAQRQPPPSTSIRTPHISSCLEKFVRSFVQHQLGSGCVEHFWTPSFTLFVLTAPHCATQLHAALLPQRQSEFRRIQGSFCCSGCCCPAAPAWML